MRKQFALFLLRWLFNSFGLWLTSRLLDQSFNDSNATGLTFLIAGLVLSLVNSLLRPILVIISLPAIVLTLGLFTLIVNGLVVYISLKLAPGLDVNFFGAVVAGIIISLINYIISGIIEIKHNGSQEKYQP